MNTTTPTTPTPAAISAETLRSGIESLQQLRTFHMSRASYFETLKKSLPCDVSIVFQDTDGRVKILDILQGETNLDSQTGFNLEVFCNSMISKHQRDLFEVNRELQTLRVKQD